MISRIALLLNFIIVNFLATLAVLSEDEPHNFHFMRPQINENLTLIYSLRLFLAVI